MYSPNLPEILRCPHEQQLPLAFEEHLWEEKKDDDREGHYHGCATPQYHATQHTYNLCHLCQQRGHWMQECKEPHQGCKGPHCLLKKSHAGFNKQNCRFPQHQIGQQGMNKWERDEEVELLQKHQAAENLEQNMNIDEDQSIPISN